MTAALPEVWTQTNAMQNIITFVGQHGPLIVFLNVLLAGAGIPLPVIPTLMTVAALASQNPYQITEIVLAGIGGTLLADFTLYWWGRRYGRRFLGLLCKMSISPDFCVRQTEAVFARVGSWSLIFSKFLPGLSLISVTIAGVTKTSVLTFLLFDGIGVLLFVGLFVALGLMFKGAVISVVAALMNFGKLGVVTVLGVLGLYLLIKWLRRRLFIHQLRMDRITVSELRQLIDDGQELVILDVRPQEVREQDGMIPGAVSAHPASIDPVVAKYSLDSEIVVYCACPNEESAASAAKHLKRAGFKRIRPLLGGIDAWVQAGHPIERIHLAKDAA
jgi:membrane protein DedA with SNARE-associated domain/rhodanese-related sulfurtransferase